MTVLKIAGIILICLYSSFLLKNMRYENIYLPVIAAATVIVGFILNSDIRNIISTVNEISGDSGIDEYMTVMIKALGISYITVITSEMCKSAGEESLSKIAESAGKFEILALCLPMTTKLIEAAKEMI